MPNRSCDFCANSYRTNSTIGYFKFTTYMRTSLKLLDVKADFICGLHFKESEFHPNGRLKSRAVPTFFPSRSNLNHDHPYQRQERAPAESEKDCHEAGNHTIRCKINYIAEISPSSSSRLRCLYFQLTLPPTHPDKFKVGIEQQQPKAKLLT